MIRNEMLFDSAFGGSFQLIVFRSLIDGAEHVALTKGMVTGDVPTMVRMHQVDLAVDLLGHAGGRRDDVSRLAVLAGYGVEIVGRSPIDT